MKMTKKEAIKTAIDAMNILVDMFDDMTEEQQAKIEEAKPILDKMIVQLEKPRSTASEEAKAAASAKKKEATAKARAELLEKVTPVLRKYLDTPVTAKELYEKAKDELPEDFTWNKVQNILIREMAPELEKTETKGKANTYVLRG